MVSLGDATPAYRGYRLQALYTLHRVLTDAVPTFQPEGKEDLAIFDSAGQLREIIQVKAYSDPLVLSRFDLKKRDSFFSRLAQDAPLDPSVLIRIITYGPCGPELQQAVGYQALKQRDVAEKIHRANSAISIDTASHLLEHMVIEEVKEAHITQNVYEKLENLCTGIDAQKAFDLMMAWLYQSAEGRCPVTRNELVEKISTIGQFLSEAAAYLREWGTVVKPIEATPISPDQRVRLAEEFYTGTLTLYEHVQADLDVIRPRQFENLDTLFAKARVVVLHGASGQGKTTLAYRYMHERFPEYCRYQIQRVENISHALSIVTAVVNHTRALQFPVMFFLDVLPGDTAWTEIARQLVREPQIRLLITIREEDWNRAALPDEVDAFADLLLTMDAAEAQFIYDILATHTSLIRFLSFAEAWTAFGENGPLMEFVHLLTQGTTLRKRLARQVERIQHEVQISQRSGDDLKVLRLVAVASACEGRLRVDALAKHLQLAAPALTFKHLEQEYFVRTSENGTLVGGLHPLRSRILVDLLTAPHFFPWSQEVTECLPFLYEPDLQVFLFTAWVTHREEIDPLVSALRSWQPMTWVGIVGILRALLWLGVADYVQTNHILFQEVVQDMGQVLMFVLDVDITGLLPHGTTGTLDQLLSHMENVSEEHRQKLQAYRIRQTPKAEIYQRVTSWLQNRSVVPDVPIEDREWLAAAEVVCWLGQLQVVWPLDEWLPLPSLESFFSTLSLENLADIVLGFSIGYGDLFMPWYSQQRASLLNRFRQETMSIKVEDDGSRITAHYIVTEEKYGTLASLRVRDSQNAIHNATLQRIWLLRRLAPDREAYGCLGRGHHLGSLQLPVDDSFKSGIPRSSLHPFWLVEHNALLLGLIKYQSRPADWQEYVDTTITIRIQVEKVLSKLVSGLEIYFRKQSMTTILSEILAPQEWEDCKKRVAVLPPLPSIAVDTWGIVDIDTKESSSSMTGNLALRRRWLVLKNYEAFLKGWNTYAQELDWFFQQGFQVFGINSLRGRQVKTDEAYLKVRQQAQILGWDPDRAPRQSTCHLIKTIQAWPLLNREFHHLFRSFVPASTLQNLEQAEQKTLNDLLVLWRWFAFTPNIIDQQPLFKSRQQHEDVIAKCLRKIRKSFQKLSTDSLQVQLFTSITWNHESVLCASFDAEKATSFGQALQSCFEAIQNALRGVRDRDTMQYELTQMWKDVVVVPLLAGKSLRGTAWRVDSLTLVNGKTLEHLGWWNAFQHELPADTLEALPLARWEHPDVLNAMRVGETVTTLWVSVAHLHDISQLPDTDADGLEIVQNYLQASQEKFSKQLQNVVDALAWIETWAKKIKQQTQAGHQVLDHIIQAQQELVPLILPSSDTSPNQEIALQEVGRWLAQLESSLSKAEKLQVLILDVIMDLLSR